MATATLGDLKTRALDYADMTGSAFPVDARLGDYLNAGLSELHDLLIQAGADDYFLSEMTYSLTPGTEDYALPSDFYKLIKLYYVTTNRRYKVERFNLDEIDGYRTSPLAGGDLELWYAPQFSPIASDATVIDARLPEGWEDFVALHGAIRLLAREESDTSVLAGEREQLRQRILKMVMPRDMGTADSIGDHYGRWDYAPRYFADDRRFKYRLLGQNIRIVEVEYVGV